MNIVFLVFNGMIPLDAVGPFEVLSRLPNASTRIVAPERGVVQTGSGMLPLLVESDISEVEEADILVIPGGPGIRDLIEDATVLDWVRRVHETTTWTASVCTGSLLLAAAGILDDKPATTHWNSRRELRGFGVLSVPERVVRDGKVITAAGVSSGIDMALALTALIAGETFAKAIQLRIEYDPHPPFDAGSLAKATPEVVELALSDLTEIKGAQVN